MNTYSTIQFADINGDGKADVCGRGKAGIWCGRSAPASSTHVEAASIAAIALPAGRIGEFWEACGFAPGDRRLAADPARIACWRSLKGAPQIMVLLGGTDAALMVVSDGTSMGVSPGETLVEFVNEAKWDKELWAWNSCHGWRLGTLRQAGRSSIATSMRLTRPATFGDPGPTTLVFSKPGFLGWWVDIAHFDPETFWELADGKVVRFIWQLD